MHKRNMQWSDWCRILIRICAISCAVAVLGLVVPVVLSVSGVIGNRALTGVIAAVVTAFVLLVTGLAVYTKFFVEIPREPMKPLERVVNEPMPKGFVEFKKRIYLTVCIRTLAVAFAAGLLALTACVAIGKFGSVAVSRPTYILLPILTAVLAAVVVIIILRPSERHVARMLDATFGMNEKVQTMLAFRNSKESMATLQRADADNRLRQLGPTALRHHSVWVCLCALILSAVMLGTSALIPVTAGEATETDDEVTGPVEQPFKLSEWQITAMENLIAEVRESDMEAAPKNAMVTELENLLAALRTTTTVTQMKTRVIATIVRADEIAGNANSYDNISKLMEISTSAEVVLLGEVIGTLDNPAYRTKLDEICAALTNVDQASAFSAGVRQAVANTGVSENDALRVSLVTLADAINAIAEETPTGWQDAMGDAFSAFYLASSEALDVQYANSETALQVRNKLMEIFGIDPSEIPKTGVSGGVGDLPQQRPEQEGQHGAPGTGDTLYGSKDMIYYPDDNTHIEYGDKISEFYAKVQEQLQGNDYNEEMKEAIIKYFEALYGVKYPNDN